MYIVPKYPRRRRVCAIIMLMAKTDEKSPVSPAPDAVQPKEVITPGSGRRRRLIIVAAIVGVVALLGLVSWWYVATYAPSSDVKTRTAAEEQRFTQANELLVLKTTDNYGRLINLTQAGDLFMQSKDPQRALDAYQKAQALIDQNKLNDGTPRSVHLQIGDAYKALGDKGKAREAYQKHQDFVKEQLGNEAELKKEIKQKLEAL